VEELIEVRSLVEAYGLKCLMKPKVLKRYRSRLERLLERTRRLGEMPRLNIEQFSKLDVEFHHIVLEAPANRIFLERNEFMSALVEFQLHNEHFSGERAQLGLGQHIKIIEAILNEEAKNAQRLLAKHLQTAEETLKGFCAGQ
jgi:DNA-binding FadR family transcriptional regulator